MTFQPFSCGECGQPVRLTTAVGRTRAYEQGFRVSIPDDFAIPTCPGCGEVYMLPEIEAQLAPQWRREFLRSQAAHYGRLVQSLTRRHGITKRDIVRACGITPSYLSHVLAGKRHASVTLTRLLEAFVANDAELLRHLDGRSFEWKPVSLCAVRASQSAFAGARGLAWVEHDKGQTEESFAAGECA